VPARDRSRGPSSKTMTDERTSVLRTRLNRELSLDTFEGRSESVGRAASQFFQDIFVQELGFEEPTTPPGDATGQPLPVDDWPEPAPATLARVVAGAGDVRVVYVELETLTRRAERWVVYALARSDRTGEWAVDGSFLAVFHAPGEDRWHLVTPSEADDITTRRPVLRRYTLGEGQTHRRVASALARLDASEAGLAIEEAFRVEPVREAFHDDYRRTVETLGDELRAEGLAAADAERYAHLTLTRLLFLAFLQTEGWLGGRPDFLAWFYGRYEDVGDTGAFHATWLSALFFGSHETGPASGAALPDDVAAVLADRPRANGGLFEVTDLDRTDAFLSDSTLRSVFRDVLAEYDFAVAEASPYDVDVAVDPGMLGTIYESLVADRDREAAGIFYTPRVEVDLLCRLALHEQLREHVAPDTVGERRLAAFVFDDPASWTPTDSDEVDALASALRGLTVLDPACGSGAFLVGMQQVLTELYGKLGREPDGDLDARLVTDSLHGVDIEDRAVRVAELRLWLSLVAGETRPPDDGPAFPDLSDTLRTGDSLLPAAGDRDGASRDEGDGFSWPDAYPAILDDGGFDVVLGNPPYVRQEAIRDQGTGATRREGTTADGTQRSYKDRLRAFVADRFDVTPYRTSDLYLYFYVRAVDLLREGGTLSFLTPNAWLDVDYGVRLQELLLTAGELEYVVEDRARRTFDAADVNSAIAVVNRRGTGRLSNDPTFLAATAGYEELVFGDEMESMLVGGDGSETLTFQGETLQVSRTDTWRSIRLSAAALWRLGGGTTSGDDGTVPAGSYRSGKWGKFVRAPTVFFEVVGAADPELVPLGRDCEVRRGTRTGANQFFYLPSKYYDAEPRGDTLHLRSTGDWPDDEYETELTIPREYWMHWTEDGWEPNRVLKTSRSFETPLVDLDALDVGEGLRYALVIDEPKSALPADVAAYVSWGESYDPSRDDLGRKTSAFPSSVSDRGVAWYDLTPALRRGDVLPMKNVDARHVYWVPERPTWIDDRLHGIEIPGGDTNRGFVAGVLNSTYGTLACEVNGRVNLGQGALDVATDDHRRTLVPPLDSVDEELKGRIAAQFERLGERPVDSIFAELGTSEPSEVTFDAVAGDRLALDRLVVQDLLGFDADTQREVYRGTLALVGQRIEKADTG